MINKLCLGTAAAFASPLFSHDDVKSFCPLTDIIHQLALKSISETGAHLIQILHYFGKPLDRVIQALVSPVFRQISYFSAMKEFYANGNYGLGGTLTLLAPLAVLFNALRGLFDSAMLLANGAVNVVVPYQTIYAVVKGKEAAREYFDCRKSIVSNIKKENNDIYIPLHGHLEHILNVSKVDKPKMSLEDIEKQYPINLDNLSYAKDKNEFVLFGLFEPGITLPLLRHILVI